MNNKLLIGIIAIIAILGVSLVALATYSPTTEFDTGFMKGEMAGTVDQSGNSSLGKGMVEYNDTDNGIRYLFGVYKNLNFTLEMGENIGLKKISTQTYNDVKWDIYYAGPEFGVAIDNNTYSGYLCIGHGKDAIYYAEISSYNVKPDETLNSELFEDYVKPLLESLTLTDPQDPPEEYEFYNMSESDFETMESFVEANGWGILNQT